MEWTHPMISACKKLLGEDGEIVARKSRSGGRCRLLSIPNFRNENKFSGPEKEDKRLPLYVFGLQR